MRKNIIVILSFLIAAVGTLLFYASLDFDANGIRPRALIQHTAEFFCYVMAFLLLSWRIIRTERYAIAWSLIAGSILYYVFDLAFGLYSDWWYISEHPDEFWYRHFGMVIGGQIMLRFEFAFLFLITYLIASRIAPAEAKMS